MGRGMRQHSCTHAQQHAACTLFRLTSRITLPLAAARAHALHAAQQGAGWGVTASALVAAAAARARAGAGCGIAAAGLRSRSARTPSIPRARADPGSEGRGGGRDQRRTESCFECFAFRK
jgi:hypothetical protein